MEQEELLLEKEIDLGGEKVIVTVFKGDSCATFHRVGPRGGRLALITVPYNLMADALYAITSDDNQESA